MRNSRPSRPVGGHAPCKQSRLIAEAELGATMERDAYLHHRAAAAIILGQPLRAVPYHVRLVHGLAIPVTEAGPDDRIRGQSLPAEEAIARAGQADPGMILVAEANVGHA